MSGQSNNQSITHSSSNDKNLYHKTIHKNELNNNNNSNLSVSFNEVLSALSALYHHPDNSVKPLANDYLIRAVQSPLIWPICDQILHNHNLSVEIHYFAATTLRSKLSYSFNDLTDEKSRLNFRNSLLLHIESYNQIDENGTFIIPSNSKAIRTSLNLCLATLVIQSIAKDEWINALNELYSFFTKLKVSNSSILFIAFLDEIAEEANSDRLGLSLEQRNTLFNSLSNYSTQLLSLLSHHSAHNFFQKRLESGISSIYSCLLSWVKNQCIDPIALLNFSTENSSLPTITSFYKSIFDSLQNAELVEICAEVIIELTHQSTNVHSYAPFQHLTTIHCLQLRSLYDRNLIASEDEENPNHEESYLICKNLMYIWTSLCDNYWELMVSMNELSSHVFELILYCMQHKMIRIVDGCLDAFYYIKEILCRIPNSHSDKSKLISWLAPFYCRMLDSTILTITRINQNVETHRENSVDESEKVEDSKRFRYRSSDSFCDSVDVLGVENILRFLYERHLVPSAQSYSDSHHQKWQHLEATLFCIRSIARSVSNNESTILPEVFQCVFGLRATPSNALKYTAVLLVGRYAEWLSFHSNLISTSFEFIVSAFEVVEIRNAASLAFKSLCEDCRDKLITDNDKHLNAIKMIYQHIVCKNELKLSDEREVIQGCVGVITILPHSKLYEFLHYLTAPIVHDLQMTVQQHKEFSSHHKPVYVDRILDRLSEILHYLDPNANSEYELVCNAAVELTKSVANLLSECQSLFIADNRIIEKVCRCWKYSMKTGRKFFKPLLHQLLIMMTQSFEIHPQSTFLYIIGIATDIFDSDEDFQRIMNDDIYERLMFKTCSILKPNTISIIQNPDLCEDLFDLLKNLVRRFPSLIYEKHWSSGNFLQIQKMNNSYQMSINNNQSIQSLIIAQLFHLSVYGVCQSHRESLVNICSFHQIFLNNVIDFPRYNASRGQKPNQNYTNIVETILSIELPFFIESLIIAITGSLEASKIQSIIPSIDSLLILKPTETIINFEVQLKKRDLTTLLPVGMNQEKAKIEFLNSLKDWTEQSSKQPRVLREIIENFNHLCTRSKEDQI